MGSRQLCTAYLLILALSSLAPFALASGTRPTGSCIVNDTARLLGNKSITRAELVPLELPGAHPRLPEAKMSFRDPEDVRLQVQVASSDFIVDRHLTESDESYVRWLHSSFKDALMALGPRDIWLDLGAGEALALKEYLTMAPNEILPHLPSDLRQRAKVIALGFGKPTPSEPLDLLVRAAEKLRGTQIYGENYGRFFQNIPSSELDAWKGKIKLLTSVYGIPDYLHTQDYPTQFKRILELLAPGGELQMQTLSRAYTFVKEDGSALVAGSQDKFTQAQGDMIRKFFGSIQGVRVKFLSWPGTKVRVVLQRTEGQIILPSIVPKKFEYNEPPERHFYWPGVHPDEP